MLVPWKQLLSEQFIFSKAFKRTKLLRRCKFPFCWHERGKSQWLYQQTSDFKIENYAKKSVGSKLLPSMIKGECSEKRIFIVANKIYDVSTSISNQSCTWHTQWQQTVYCSSFTLLSLLNCESNVKQSDASSLSLGDSRVYGTFSGQCSHTLRARLSHQDGNVHVHLPSTILTSDPERAWSFSISSVPP